VEDLPVNWSGISLARGEEHGNRIFDAHYGDLFDRMARQSRAMAAAGWLSPTVAVGGLSSALAASDTASHVAFVRAAERQRRLIQRTLNDAIARHPERGGAHWLGDRALWDSIPPFRFTYPPLAWDTLFARQLLPLLALTCASVCAAWLGVRRLRTGSLK
jgi:ABC-2 type transport system permease protein